MLDIGCYAQKYFKWAYVYKYVNHNWSMKIKFRRFSRRGNNVCVHLLFPTKERDRQTDTSVELTDRFTCQGKTDWVCTHTHTNGASRLSNHNTRVYPKVSGLAAWSEIYKWYISLPLGVTVSLFCESF